MSERRYGLDEALKGLSEKQEADRGYTGVAGQVLNPCTRTPARTARDILLEAADEHARTVEGLRAMARLIPDDGLLTYDAREALVAAAKLVAR